MLTQVNLPRTDIGVRSACEVHAPSSKFKVIPEYMVEDMADYMVFISRYRPLFSFYLISSSLCLFSISLPNALLTCTIEKPIPPSRYSPKCLLSSSSITHVVALLVMFMGRGVYVRNPYLRSKLAEVLYLFSCADEVSIAPMRNSLSAIIFYFSNPKDFFL